MAKNVLHAQKTLFLIQLHKNAHNAGVEDSITKLANPVNALPVSSLTISNALPAIYLNISIFQIEGAKIVLSAKCMIH